MSGHISLGFQTPSWSWSSETSPTPSPSLSDWSGFAVNGLLSIASLTPSPSESSKLLTATVWIWIAVLLPSGTVIWVWVTTTGTFGSPSSWFIFLTSTSYILSLLWSRGFEKSGG